MSERKNSVMSGMYGPIHVYWWQIHSTDWLHMHDGIWQNSAFIWVSHTPQWYVGVLGASAFPFCSSNDRLELDNIYMPPRLVLQLW